MVDRASLALVKAKSEMHLNTSGIMDILISNEINGGTANQTMASFVRSESSLDSYNERDSASMRAAASAVAAETANSIAADYEKISESFLNSLNDAALSVKPRRMSASSSMSSQSVSMVATSSVTAHRLSHDHRARNTSKSGKKKKSKSKKEKSDLSPFNIPCSQLLTQRDHDDLFLNEDNYDKIKQQLICIDMIDLRKMYKLKPDYTLDDSDEMIDEWSVDPVAIKTSGSHHHHHNSGTTGAKSALSKSKSLTAKSSSLKNAANASSNMFRCFKDPQAYMSYYKAEKFAKVLANNTRSNTTMNEVNAVGNIVNLTPNSVYAVLNPSIQQSAGLSNPETPNNAQNSSSSLPQLTSQPQTPPAAPTIQRAVTNIGFKMIDPSINKQGVNSYQSGGPSSSDALLQKLIPYTTQGNSIRAAGGGTLRISPKAYRSRYQYQFARNLIAKIITTNQQNAKTLLKKNEKYLNNAMAQQQQNGFLMNNNSVSYQNLTNLDTSSSAKEPITPSNNSTADYSYYSITNLDNNQSISILENELNTSSNVLSNSNMNLAAKVVKKPGKRVIEFYNRPEENSNQQSTLPPSNLGRVMSIRRPRLPRTGSNLEINHLDSKENRAQNNPAQLNSVLSSKNLNPTRENSKGRTATPPDIQLISVGATPAGSSSNLQQSRSLMASREYTMSRGSSISTPGVKRDQSLAAVRARLAATASAKNLANNANNQPNPTATNNNNNKKLLAGVVNNYTVKFQV